MYNIHELGMHLLWLMLGIFAIKMLASFGRPYIILIVFNWQIRQDRGLSPAWNKFEIIDPLDLVLPLPILLVSFLTQATGYLSFWALGIGALVALVASWIHLVAVLFIGSQLSTLLLRACGGKSKFQPVVLNQEKCDLATESTEDTE